MHYKTIKFNIKIPLNIHNFHFCGALRAKSLIFRICDFFFLHFFFFAFCLHFSNPPNPKNGSTPLFSPPPPPPTSKKLPTPLLTCTHWVKGRFDNKREKEKLAWLSCLEHVLWRLISIKEFEFDFCVFIHDVFCTLYESFFSLLICIVLHPIWNSRNTLIQQEKIIGELDLSRHCHAYNLKTLFSIVDATWRKELNFQDDVCVVKICS